MNTPAPDYGEPWQIRKTYFSCPFTNRDGQVIENENEKILACVNALAGVQDPAAHLASLNQELAELREWKRQQLEVENQWNCQKVGKMLGVPFGENIRPHIEPKIASLNAAIERWESELSATMPPDFKDWHENAKSEWPEVARRVIESLREREEQSWQAAERYEETVRVMNDALKEANRIFGNIGHCPVVKALCPDFAEVAEKVKQAHDPHA